MKQKVNTNKIIEEILKEAEIKDPYIPIQKYYSKERFEQALKEDRFTFQKPSNWDDPFEDFVSKLINKHKDAIVNRINITNGIYAMSTVSKKVECDGLWRNFAGKNGVMVRMKLESLLGSIIYYLLNSFFEDKSIFQNSYDIEKTLVRVIKIRKVKYLSDGNIANIFRGITKNLDLISNLSSYKLLSIKRNEFEYENEYRFFINQELLKLEEEHFLPIGYFKECIEKVVIFPFKEKLEYGDTSAEDCIRELCKNYELAVEKSTLYDIDFFKKQYNL